MAFEIQEISIGMTVSSAPSSGAAAKGGGSCEGGDKNSPDSSEFERMVQQCVHRVLQAIRASGER